MAIIYSIKFKGIPVDPLVLPPQLVDHDLGDSAPLNQTGSDGYIELSTFVVLRIFSYVLYMSYVYILAHILVFFLMGNDRLI